MLTFINTLLIIYLKCVLKFTIALVSLAHEYV